MVTVAIPVLNGGRRLGEVLSAIRAQRIDDELELLVCDSGSTDGSVASARAAGARLLEVPRGEFHHAGTRNLLLTHARGEFVAMLTQDATPIDDRWLARLLSGFDAADRVGLVYGRYRPRGDCPPLEAQRLTRFFDSLSPDGRPRIDRLGRGDSPAPLDIGPARGYFTDANGAIRRAAWQQTPFPSVPYAEDHALALTMLRAGWAKVYEPSAAVSHSHHYSAREQMRRSFDDFRALREIYGYRPPTSVGDIAVQMRGALGVGLRGGSLTASVANQALSLIGASLGSHAERLSPDLRRRLSLQRRATFEPLCWEPAGPAPQRCT